MNDFNFNEKNMGQGIRLMICGFSPVYRKMLCQLFGDDATICDFDPYVIIAEEGADEGLPAVPTFVMGSTEGQKKNKIFLRRPADIKALRQSVLAAARQKIEAGEKSPELTADSSTLTVSLGSLSVRLTSLEFALFHLLYEKRGATVSREQINRALWQEGEGSNVCDVYVCYLRKKLDPLIGKGNIVSVRGEGYMLKK